MTKSVVFTLWSAQELLVEAGYHCVLEILGFP